MKKKKKIRKQTLFLAIETLIGLQELKIQDCKWGPERTRRKTCFGVMARRDSQRVTAREWRM